MQTIAIGMRTLWSALAVTLLLAACTSTPPAAVSAPPVIPESAGSVTPAGSRPAPAKRFDGPGHNYATAITLANASNPLAFSQKQQEWLWLNYRDWKKQGQALREHDGVQYDEVTLVNKQGETRVIYFRMPKKGGR